MASSTHLIGTVIWLRLACDPGSVLHAQRTLDPDGTPGPCNLPGKVAPYAALREADVFWERRVWRTIDLKEPSNHLLRSVSGTTEGCFGLFDIIRHGLLDEGAITAYDPGPLQKDDAFKVPYTRDELVKLFTAIDSIPESIVTRLMIKEDWLFNKQRGEMEVRIIGIAPMLELRGTDGELRGHRPLFWLYYPECRTLFARWLAFVKKEDGAPHSYEEIFSQRLFSGTIQKVSNVMDRDINDHQTGLDALLESEALREQLFQLGFDLWNY